MRKPLIILVVIVLISTLAYVVFKRNNGSVPSLSSVLNRTQTEVGSTPSNAQVSFTPGVARELVVEASEYSFSPSEIRIKKGESVKITLKNVGAMPHNWTVEGLGGASIDTANAGSSNSITITPSQKGKFTVFCSIGSHRALGMQGSLIVE